MSVLVLGLVVGGGFRASETPSPAGGEAYHDGMTWKDVERLRSEDRYAAAVEVVEKLLQRAIADKDADEWTRALVHLVQLRTALHGYETSVRLLQEREWPESTMHRAILELFYAQGLVTYIRGYSWEIAQRELVDTDGVIDLKRWTQDQIFAEAQQAFRRVWQDRARWGERGLGTWAEYLDQNNYPARIRGTLRDALTYMWAQLLADSSLWRPRHANQVHRLDRESLIERGGSLAALDGLDDVDLHPLVKIAALLDDLEAWHLANERPEAAFEARLQKLQYLNASLEHEDDRAAIRLALRQAVEDLGSRYPWWSMGQAVLAAMVQQEPSADALIRAREIAQAGESAHPDSVGGQRCRHLVAAIEAPSFDLSAMQVDGSQRRSLLIRHKNLGVLHFRAYRLDLLKQIETSQDYNLLPGYRQVPEVVSRQLPHAEWSQELPDTPDYRQHQTFSTPPMTAPGMYLVVASARQSFSGRNNRLVAVNLLISDLVLLTRNMESGFEVEVRSGASGQARVDVEVLLYRYDHRKGHRRVASRRTDDRGLAMFEGSERQHERYFLVARDGEELGLDATALWSLTQSSRARTRTLVYTDRSVYRPQQKVQWKVVAYFMGEEAEARVLAGRRLQIDLRDANHQVVESLDVETNSFGTASGEFEIPAGGLLGRWHLRASHGGATPIQVEEYKRPTFEVTLEEPAAPLRLNREARLRGEARYYFGLPVVEAEVAWQVERVPVYPRWWWHWGREPVGSEVIAAGNASTDSRGLFDISFLPEADERHAADGGVSYNFRLTADLVDDGGETRSAQRIFRLGFVAVQAVIEADRGFFVTGEPVAIGIRRTDLDGNPRSGSGHWDLVRLQSPEETLLPADQPISEPADEARRFATPGDAKRPRWAPDYDPEQVVSLWQPGAQVAADSTSHDDEGLTRIDLGSLPGGIYRLRYRTRDEFGAEFAAHRNFVVADEGGQPVALPVLFAVERSSVAVGETARLMVMSGLANQQLVLEVFQQGRRIDRQELSSAAGVQVIEIPVGRGSRGGLGVRLTAVRDHQLMSFSDSVFVPWEDRQLKLRFSSFRDLLRPGQRETWRVAVEDWRGDLLETGAAELLAYMYDRSLDIFAPHQPPDILAQYPTRTGIGPLQVNLGGRGQIWSDGSGFGTLPGYPHLIGDRLKFFDGYGIGGPGMRGRLGTTAAKSMAPMSADLAMEAEASRDETQVISEAPWLETGSGDDTESIPPGEAPRTDFSETAFWEPHLLAGDDGSVAFEFTVPDSVTEWNVWVHAVTRDLRGGSLHAESRSAKDLMVRPYLPRFLREGDRARLEVMVNNSSEGELAGDLDFEIRDPVTGESLLAEFGIDSSQATRRTFSVAAGGSTVVDFELMAPARVGQVAIEVTAHAGDWSDGELRPLPLLPGRMHLRQSRFAALRDADRRQLHFADMAANDDSTLLHEQLVVTLDAQLFHGVLQALPYLASFPYECTEQTLNRFLSTGIVTSLYEEYPAVARMAGEFSQRETQFETWDGADANRKMALVETPWLRSAQGGEADKDQLLNVLDPRIAEIERRSALAKLAKAQTSLGGFSWWPGGPPSPYMTLYLLHGFSRALEFGIEVPQEMIVRGWQYMHRHYVDELVQSMMGHDCCWEMVTFLNYVLSSYPEVSWTGEVFSQAERQQMLDFSFRHWRRHSPMLKSYLALTLQRAGREEDARRVFDSVMDSSRTTRDEGTFWAPEDRAWLWYNDTMETHAFALRTLTEIEPDDERRHGLVHWLFLNKQLNHWKSTRATAEVIYSLVHYLDREGNLGQRESARVQIGPRERTFAFAPDAYTGGNNQWILEGSDIQPESDSTVVVDKSTPGLMFASATWHFSTEELPKEARGDLFSVNRTFYRRSATEDGWKLQPLSAGDTLEVGDQVEVQLSLRTRHAAEYVHLRDPRGAGFEPVSATSSYKWDLGIGWYEEIRDSGTSFFFDWLPAGEYTFRYRLRVSMAGTFKVAPAVVQSMYAPEFSAYSAGAEIGIEN